jgi:hypothetical protein
VHSVLARFGRCQLDSSPIAGRTGPAEHAQRAEGVDDSRHRIRPHVQMSCELTGPDAGMFGDSRKHFKLRDC